MDLEGNIFKGMAMEDVFRWGQIRCISSIRALKLCVTARHLVSKSIIIPSSPSSQNNITHTIILNKAAEEVVYDEKLVKVLQTDRTGTVTEDFANDATGALTSSTGWLY